MYFVICVNNDANEHLIVPVEWIKDYTIALEKFINYSINSNQKYLCFYNSSENAVFNHADDADFSAPLQNTTVGSGKMCLYVKIKKYFGELILLII